MRAHQGRYALHQFHQAGWPLCGRNQLENERGISKASTRERQALRRPSDSVGSESWVLSGPTRLLVNGDLSVSPPSSCS